MTTPSSRRHVVSASNDPAERGRQRGEQLRATLPGALEVYLQLFDYAQIAPGDVRDHALHSAEALDEWRPARRQEIDGIAAGAGLEPWQLHALNARTEILATSTRELPPECSTLAHRAVAADGSVRTFSIQTWDWHVELDPFWHTHETRGGRHDVAGWAEDGMLAKGGVNSAGLATHFNILGHELDHAGGVPVHVVSATVLEEAASVDEALEIMRSAPVSASSALTLLDAERVLTVEMTSVGVFATEPVGGSVIRTNHFLDPVPSAHERAGLDKPDSTARYDLIRSRLDHEPAPGEAADLLPYLFSEPEQPRLCAVPDMSLALGERWGSLATVLLEPAARTVRVADGTPLAARAGEWRVLMA